MVDVKLTIGRDDVVTTTQFTVVTPNSDVIAAFWRLFMTCAGDDCGVTLKQSAGKQLKILSLATTYIYILCSKKYHCAGLQNCRLLVQDPLGPVAGKFHPAIQQLLQKCVPN